MSARRSIPGQQTCKACGEPDKFNFHVLDAIWEAVVPPELATRVVCLYCFDEFAQVAGVAYARFIDELWFAGRRAVFCFRPALAIDC